MKHLLILLTIILLSGNLTLPAQPANQDEGFLIMFEPDVKAEDVLSKNLFLQDGELIIVEHFEYVNIWWVQHRPEKITREAALQRLKSEPGIRYAEPIRNQVTLRGSIPNDPLFSDQWGMKNTGQTGGTPGADISATKAWQITRGDSWGTHVPVVAVVDNGFQQNHPDLAFLSGGYNAYDDNFNVPVADHGTFVTGVLGATTNNGTGIAGVMWGTEVFPVAGSSANETVVVRAYNHILGLRQQYNNSGGSSGRFIVATNTSFGVDEADPEDYPYWCAMYDAMGAAGIISVAATINANVDVDQVGDVPTACDSDYLITVTSTNHNDNRHLGAGYGAQTINLGAPGTNIKSTLTTLSGTYGYDTGTSFATPHVTGTIGLMYSILSESQISNSISNPGPLALEIKDIVLNSVEPNSSLNGITTTGGRLNAYSAVKDALPQQLEDHTFTSFAYPPAVTLTESAHIFGSSIAESGLTITIPSDKIAVLDGSLSRTGSNHATMVVEGTLIMDEDAVLDGFTIEIGEQGFLLMRDNTAITGQGGSLAVDGVMDIGDGALVGSASVEVGADGQVTAGDQVEFSMNSRRISVFGGFTAGQGFLMTDGSVSIYEGASFSLGPQSVLEFYQAPPPGPSMLKPARFYAREKVELYSLTMRGSSGGSWSGAILSGPEAAESWFSSVTIEDASTGLRLLSTSDISLYNLTIRDTGLDGILVHGTYNVEVLATEVKNAGRYGIQMDGGEIFTMNNTLSENNGSYGFHIHGAGTVVNATANKFRGSAQAGVNVSDDSYASLNGSSVYNNSGHQFTVNGDSQAEARNSWWGAYPVDSLATFLVASGSMLDWSNPLSFDPNPNLRTPIAPAADHNAGSSSVERSPDSFRLVWLEQLRSDREAAIRAIREQTRDLPGTGVYGGWKHLALMHILISESEYEEARQIGSALLETGNLQWKRDVARSLFLMYATQQKNEDRALNKLDMLLSLEDPYALDGSLEELLYTVLEAQTEPMFSQRPSGALTPTPDTESISPSLSNYPNPFNPASRVLY